MTRLMVAALVAALFTVVGCQRGQGQGQGQSGGGSQNPNMMSGDACAMCEGVQQATADGKCPSCNMAVKDPNMMSADACDHCPGVQKANAEGKCAECAAKHAAPDAGQPAPADPAQPAQ